MPDHVLQQRTHSRPNRALAPLARAGLGIETRHESTAMTALARWMKSWGRNTADWVQSATERLGGPARDERIFDELADIVRSARAPAEIEVALVRLACQMAGARHAELVLEPTARAVTTAHRRLITCWPEAAALDAAEPSPSCRQAAASCDKARAGLDPPPGGSGPQTPLDLAVGPVARFRTTLRVIPAPGERWTPRLIRQLTTLCTLAAAARTALEATRPATNLVLPSPAQASAGTNALRDERFLTTFLSYALAQAKRSENSLSLICVEIDRFAAIQTLLGCELAESAMHRVAATIIRVLRAGDVVARLDEGRLIVALALANGTDARAVAETVRQAIACMGSASASLPVLTASLGVVTYPDDASDAPALIHAATEAVTHNPTRAPTAASGDEAPREPPSRIMLAYRREG